MEQNRLKLANEMFKDKIRKTVAISMKTNVKICETEAKNIKTISKNQK